ncbi:hypothetical protein JQX08_05855 [Pseudomonas sp. UL073]|uniref:Uncharacterized protein n=1 Tax=Zestomonas insulae TaxID=2809017 RepID=A0ABS2ID43_9GAMM|nr:hypothetical protein [Pseudomonas insulae]MBM7060224.1 hypothetical protein [Pseudomonas insulae]
MAQWTITFSKDDSTQQISLEAARKPSMEEATRHLLEWAQANLQPGEYGDRDDRGDEPAQRLLRHYGATITGITRE